MRRTCTCDGSAASCGRRWRIGSGSRVSAADVIALALQVFALHLGALSVVQPLLITGLLFALVLRQQFGSYHISRRQVGWAVTLAAALAGFLLLAGRGSPPGLPQPVDHVPAVVAGIAGAALIAACVMLARRRRGGERSAALLGVAVGLIYAADAALIKALTDIAVRSPLKLLISWQSYSLLALGATGLVLNQLAFQAGPLTASLPATAAVDPLLSIVIGVAIYDEQLRVGPGAGIILLALMLLIGLAGGAADPGSRP